MDFPRFSPDFRVFHTNSEFFARIPTAHIIDAKSVYDHLCSPGSTSTLSDKFVAIDVALIKDAMKTASTKARWAPSSLQLGDCLTKPSADSCDISRAVMMHGKYQLRSEEMALKMGQTERDRRRALAGANQEAAKKKMEEMKVDTKTTADADAGADAAGPRPQRLERRPAQAAGLGAAAPLRDAA